MTVSRADLLRRRARDCEARARSLADRADTTDDPEASRQLVQASDAEAIVARVLHELAEIEDEADA